MEVRNATPDDRDQVIATFTRAFSGDAIVRFLFANEKRGPTARPGSSATTSTSASPAAR